jgi:hypothetical protein
MIKRIKFSIARPLAPNKEIDGALELTGLIEVKKIREKHSDTNRFIISLLITIRV